VLFSEVATVSCIDPVRTWISGTQTTESFTAIQNAAIQESAALAALTPTQTISSDITTGVTFTGNGGLNVIALNGQINLNTGNNLTFAGGANDTFVINIAAGKNVTFQNGASSIVPGFCSNHRTMLDIRTPGHRLTSLRRQRFPYAWHLPRFS